MRLIDADALIEKINELAEGNEDYVQRYLTLLAARGLVQDAPTAYDVEKIVEEIEQKSFPVPNSAGKYIYKEYAVDAVRKGGVE